MSSQDFQQQMRQAISQHFNLGELQQLAFDLNLDWDELVGPTKSGKIVALVVMMARHGRLPDLLTQLRQRYPAVDWPEPPPGAEVTGQVSPANGFDLSGADLHGAGLDAVDLRGANLRGADLRRAGLYRANLSGADLRDADCRGAKMRKANLSQADLRGADLKGADMRLANLYGAKVAASQLAKVKLHGATLPNGQRFNPERPLPEQVDFYP